MKISCEIIRDLLPLYHDNVCSKQSCKLVEEHLETCEKCKSELNEIATDIKGENHMEDTKPIRAIAKKWKHDKKSSFFKGAMLVSIIACIACSIAYNSIGSYIAEDGTLVEAFGFIPLAFLFGFIGLLSAICLGVILISRYIKQRNV